MTPAILLTRLGTNSAVPGCICADKRQKIKRALLVPNVTADQALAVRWLLEPCPEPVPIRVSANVHVFVTSTREFGYDHPATSTNSSWIAERFYGPAVHRPIALR
jgi:hypothetical protein